MFTSLASRACERKWRKDHGTGRRQPNRSQSFRSVPISDAGMITTAAVNSAVWTMVCHSALKTVPVSCVRTGCQKLGQPRRKQRRRKVRWWTIRWSYTHQGTLFLPSVPSPKIRPRPSGRKQPQVPLNPSPWLPASRPWDGPAPKGRTTAGRGRLNVREDTARNNVTSLQDISRHAVTATAATGERASGPGQVPLVVPARVDVPSPAVSLRRRTPVRQTLPLAIIIILRAIVDPSHHLHHGRLQTASLSPVTARDDERAPIGRVGRLSPDGMSSYLLRSPRPLRSVRSRWLPRRARQIHIESAPEVPVPAPAVPVPAPAVPVPAPAADGSAGAGPAASGGSATSDGPAARNGTATGNDPTTGDGSATGNGPATGDSSATGNGPATGDGSATEDGWTTGDGPVTVDGSTTVDDMTIDNPADVSMVESSHSSVLRFDDPDDSDGPAPLPAAGVDVSAGHENPAATPVGGPDVSSLTGTSTPPLFPSIPKTINQSTLVDFMSLWTLLQRHLDLPTQLALRRWPNVGIGRHRRDRQPTSRQRWYFVACVATVCWHSVGARRLAYRSLPMFCVWTSVVGIKCFSNKCCRSTRLSIHQLHI